MASLNLLFSELPYASVLESQYLQSRCSYCFQNAEGKLLCECKRVVYCDDRCKSQDRSSHCNECRAFAGRRPASEDDHVELHVRFVGRLLSRYEADGGRSSSSTGFPTHLAKHRRLDDLMSHERDMKRHYPQYIQEITSAFFKFFDRTPLADQKRSTVVRLYCVSSINAFTITFRSTEEPDSLVDYGQGVYLDASRFNHSCRPPAVYHFDGNRIVLKAEDTVKLNAKSFKTLTINYGFGDYNTCLSTKKERLSSLKSRYFFRCQCHICKDKNSNRLACNASRVECEQCQAPYVWRFRGDNVKKLKRLCNCKTSQRYLPADLELAEVVLELNKEMEDFAERSMENSEVIQSVWPLIVQASRVWHPRYNVRLGQLCERLFDAMFLDWWDQGGDANDDSIARMLDIGEHVMHLYIRYMEPYSIPFAISAQRLAQLYHVRKSQQKSAHWFGVASRIWEARGDDQCVKYIESIKNES